MFEAHRVWTALGIALIGVAIFVLGLTAGGGAWLPVVVGLALVAASVLLLVLDPPGRDPYRPPWRPWRR